MRSWRVDAHAGGLIPVGREQMRTSTPPRPAPRWLHRRAPSAAPSELETLYTHAQRPRRGTGWALDAPRCAPLLSHPAPDTRRAGRRLDLEQLRPVRGLELVEQLGCRPTPAATSRVREQTAPAGPRSTHGPAGASAGSLPASADSLERSTPGATARRAPRGTRADASATRCRAPRSVSALARVDHRELARSRSVARRRPGQAGCEVGA